MNPWQTALENLQNMGNDFIALLPQIIVGLIILVLIIFSGRLLDTVLGRMFARAGLRSSLAHLFRKLIGAGVWVIAILVTIMIIFPTVTPGAVVTALGFTSIALGFAFRDVVVNFLAGILILAREPFSLGDFIECNGKQGKVETMDLRYTYLRQVDGQRVVLPNGILFRDPVTVTTDWRYRRITIIVNIDYHENLSRVREVIYQAVSTCPSVHQEKEIEIFIQALSASSVDYEVTWWAGSSILEFRQSRDEVAETVKRALMEADIEIAYPYRTLIVKKPVSINLNRLPPDEADKI